MGRAKERYTYENGKIITAKCSKCKQWKSVDDFYIAKNKLPYYLCKECNKEQNKKRKLGIRKRMTKEELYLYDSQGNITHRKCKGCGQYKELSHYYFNFRRSIYFPYCNSCKKIVQKKYYNKFRKIYIQARKQRPILPEDETENIKMNEYKGNYCLINPELRSAKI